jgi:hypothetical protein
MARTARRDDRASRKARRQAAADRRIGHDMAYVYETTRILGPVVAVLALAAGLLLLWTRVDHTAIAKVTGAAGVLLTSAYAFWWVRTGSTYARTMALATGRPRSPYWHAVGGAGILLMVASYLIWQQL